MSFLYQREFMNWAMIIHTCWTDSYWIHFAIANAFLPASVINPRVSKSAHRCLLSSVQWLRLRRGDKRCASLPSGRRFSVESIQPKQSDSSTTSIYGKQAAGQGGRLLRYMAIQHSFASSPCSSSQLRNWSRRLNSSRLVIPMIEMYACKGKEIGVEESETV